MFIKLTRASLVVILILRLTVTECMSPVKGVHSLEMFEDTHLRLTNVVLSSQAEQIVNKITKLEQLKARVMELSVAERQLSSLPSPPPKPNKDPNAALRDKYISERKMFSDITKEFNRLFPGLEFDTTKNYGELFLQKIINGIKIGNYNELFASLPKAFNAPIFNTFACAFSFIYEDGEKIDIFFPAKEVPGDSSNCGGIPLFISGESRLALAPMAIQAQSSSLGGDLPTEIFGKKIEGLESYFRHSEQKAFVHLLDLEKVNFILLQLSRTSQIKEIIFNGCTLRDMCPNCCATLTAHEKLAYHEELGYKVKQESFLVTLQRAIARTQHMAPTVTSIVSSLIRYYPEGEEPISWSLQTHTSLLNPREISPSGIVSRFVNQFRFSEKVFLQGLLAALEKITPGPEKEGSVYNDHVHNALKARLVSLP